MLNVSAATACSDCPAYLQQSTYNTNRDLLGPLICRTLERMLCYSVAWRGDAHNARRGPEALHVLIAEELGDVHLGCLLRELQRAVLQ